MDPDEVDRTLRTPGNHTLHLYFAFSGGEHPSPPLAMIRVEGLFAWRNAPNCITPLCQSLQEFEQEIATLRKELGRVLKLARQKFGEAA